nr:glycosyltransferase family 25 protein [uncultured Moellerella sp.]
MFDFVNIDWSFIEKIVYINLDSRPERETVLKSEFEKLKIPQDKIIRFEAIKTTPGVIGCSKSHMYILEMAQRENWKNILIIEDDSSFKYDLENVIRVNQYFTTLNNIHWDVAFLSANYFSVTPTIGNFVLRVHQAYGANAYIVNQHYYETLLASVRKSVRQLEACNGMDSTGENVMHSLAIDALWLDLMPKDTWYGIFPNFGYQRPSHSDILNGSVDYTSCFYKDIAKITK